MKKIREWISIKTVKSPGMIILLVIVFANIAIIGVSALIISSLTPSSSMENSGFWHSVLNTMIMYLGIGGIDTVIEDIGQADFVLVLSCVVIIIIGLVIFTYALIGYMSELISGFIKDADSNSRKLHISGHIIILNWNTRAAEIINELLLKNKKEKIVVLVENNKQDILNDINERLSDTINDINEEVTEANTDMRFFKRRHYIREHKIKNKLTIIVREGDSCSTKQLNDISIKSAKCVVILSNDNSGYEDIAGNEEKGDAHTIKTLLQVSHMTAEEDSADNQQVVAEVKDNRTLSLVETVIKQKMRKGKCNITPVAANQILGKIFSQFSIMPELNIVYSTLFSNKSASLYVQSSDEFSLSDTEFISDFLNNHLKAIPLTVIHDEDGKYYRYFLSDNEQQIDIIDIVESVHLNRDFKVSLNHNFGISNKHIIILGHNSKSISIMEGFKSFCGEWTKKDDNDDSEALNVTVIDDEANLTKQEYYKQYPFVKKAVAADIFDKELISEVIDEFIGLYINNACVIILSNDMNADKDIDSDALMYLILVQDIINKRIADDSAFDPNSIDLVVEILDPKNYDIVSNYSADNIVISNRYISKMIMQIGEKEYIYNFYDDILNYEVPNENVFIAKEMYIKKAVEFFSEMPGECTAAELIRAVYHASLDNNKSVVLGYFRSDGKMILFGGDQSKINMNLTEKDKLIVFSNH